MNPCYNLADVNNVDTAANPPPITINNIILSIIDLATNPKKYNLNIHINMGNFWGQIKKKEPFKKIFNGIDPYHLDFYWRTIRKEKDLSEYYKLVQRKSWLIDFCDVPIMAIFRGISCYFRGYVKSLEEFLLTRVPFEHIKDKVRILINNHTNKTKI